MGRQDYFDLLLKTSMEEERQNLPFAQEDRQTLGQLLAEINHYAGTDFTTLAELAAYNVHGSGTIVARFIEQFQSEVIRMELLHQLVADRVENCGQLLIRLYGHYRSTWPRDMEHVQCAVSYDNAFWRLKSRKIKRELFELTGDLASVVGLPLTMGMLASWKMPEMEPFLLSCVRRNDLDCRSFGLSDRVKVRTLQYAKDELIYRGLRGLRYYPSAEAVDALQQYARCDNENMRVAAQASLNYIYKRMKGEERL